MDLGVYFDAYAANGLEGPERARFATVVAHAALLLCQADVAGEIARHPAGYARILEFARRFELLTPSPDPECLAAIGYLRWVDPTLRNVADARRDLERALAEQPALADSTRAHRVLAALRAAVH